MKIYTSHSEHLIDIPEEHLFLGECKGIALVPRADNDNHVCFLVLTEDDGNWFTSEHSASSYWLAELVHQLLIVEKWLVRNAIYDGHGGYKFKSTDISLSRKTKEDKVMSKYVAVRNFTIYAILENHRGQITKEYKTDINNLIIRMKNDVFTTVPQEILNTIDFFTSELGKQLIDAQFVEEEKPEPTFSIGQYLNVPGYGVCWLVQSDHSMISAIRIESANRMSSPIPVHNIRQITLQELARILQDSSIDLNKVTVVSSLSPLVKGLVEPFESKP